MSGYLDPRALAAQSHEVLAASVAAGAREIGLLREALNHALGALREEKRFGTVGIIQDGLVNNGITLSADDFQKALATSLNDGPAAIERLKKKIHTLRVVGDKMACNIRGSAIISPDNWHQPGVVQMLEEWDAVLEATK